MFWDNLEAACKAKGVKVTPILKELKISSGNIGRWQKGGTVTSDTIVLLAKRLNVTADFLLTGEHSVIDESGETFRLSQCEKDLISMFRQLPDLQKELISDSIRSAYGRLSQEGQNERRKSSL